MAKRICSYCGKEFEPNSGNQKYCSGACCRKANRNTKNIRKHVDGMRDIRLQVIHHFNYRCAVCGWQIPGDTVDEQGRTMVSHGCEIHHIIPVRDGGKNTGDNMILLCPNCHKMADVGLLSKEILKQRLAVFDRGLGAIQREFEALPVAKQQALYDYACELARENEAKEA